MLNNGRRAGALTVCQFQWCKYSHDGPFQNTIVMSLVVELGRECTPLASQEWASTPPWFIKVGTACLTETWAPRNLWLPWGPGLSSSSECLQCPRHHHVTQGRLCLAFAIYSLPRETGINPVITVSYTVRRTPRSPIWLRAHPCPLFQNP